MTEQNALRKRHLWAIVLAGGKGARISPLSKRLIGREVPKQYLPLLSSKRSLLQETHDRLVALVPQERTVLVVAKEWAGLAAKQLSDYIGVRVIPQPADRGTASGILLPLCHVLAHDPDADVLVTPSDHHISDDLAFNHAVQGTLAAIESYPKSVALLGRRFAESQQSSGDHYGGRRLVRLRDTRALVRVAAADTQQRQPVSQSYGRRVSRSAGNV